MSQQQRLQLDEAESRILHILEDADRPRLHTQEIAEEAEVTRHTASKYLSVLEAKGLVGHDQVGNAKVWYPVHDDIMLRTLTLDDLDEVVAVANRIQGIADEAAARENLRRELRSQLNETTEFSVGAEAESGIIGYIVGERRSWEFGSPEEVGWIRILGIHPDYQDMGIGRRLSDEIFRRFERAGVHRVRTIVDWDESDLLPFFHSLGFDMNQSTVLERSIDIGQQA